MIGVSQSAYEFVGPALLIAAIDREALNSVGGISGA